MVFLDPKLPGTEVAATLSGIRGPGGPDSHRADWVPELDHLRALAILAVLAIHTSSGMTQVVPLNWAALAMLGVFSSVQFAVPMFIFISGFALTRNHATVSNRWAFYMHRARGIVPQYILFSALYIAFYVWLGQRPPTRAGLVRDIVFGDAAFHLRFLPFLMQFYILFPILIDLYLRGERRGWSSRIVVGALGVQLAWNAFVYAIDARLSDPLQVETVNSICLSSIFYFVAGIHVARDLGGFRRVVGTPRARGTALAVATLLTGVVAAYYIAGIVRFGYYYDIPGRFLIVPSLIQPFQIATEFVLAWWLAGSMVSRRGRIADMSLRIGAFAFGIYLVHVFAYTVLVRELPAAGLGFGDWAWYPMAFVGMLASSYALIRVLSPLPAAEILLGIRRHPILAAGRAD